MNPRINPETIRLSRRENETLRMRRRLMLALNLLTLAGIAVAAASIASSGGWTLPGILLLFCVVAITPWNAIGFWNSLVGLILLHVTRSGPAAAAPFLRTASNDPVVLRTAILMTLRNEDPARAISRLRAVRAELDATPYGAMFDIFILSDTSLPEIARAEEEAVARWRAESGGRGLFYRRREANTGFKAGNVRDFCDRWGEAYEFMLPLDADSLMGASAIIDMARILQADPRIGILQSLVVGLPSRSAFARMFQFGMRAGMRCYTLGATWWAGDCGPFWGHNALIRIAPFRRHCDLPLLPGAAPLGGHILSHDQVEAVLMRRAGYEVRVVPVETESFEENPPTLPDFLTRDARWCLGNLQYLKLLGLPGAHAMGRFQLAWAILMFLTVPALPLALLLLPFAAPAVPAEAGPATATLYLVLLGLCLFPKLAGYLDVALTPGMARRYGGAVRFAVSAALELAFSFLLSAISAFATSRLLVRLFLLRSRNPAGEWGGQARDAHRVSWRRAVAAFAAPTLFGLVVVAALAWQAPQLIVWLAPLFAGLCLAIPFAVLSAEPAFGTWLARHGICATPEERAPPRVLQRLSAPQADLRPAAPREKAA